MLAECKFAITDSGGLQEELSFFGKLCIVCREQTERLMGLGKFSYLCLEPSNLEELFNKVNSNYNSVMGMPSPYGNGKSAERILKLIKDGYISEI